MDTSSSKSSPKKFRARGIMMFVASFAFAEHKPFKEKYIIGCSAEQIETANSLTTNFRSCAEELCAAGPGIAILFLAQLGAIF